MIGVGTFSATNAMYTNVLTVLISGRLSYGPFSKELEERFSEQHGCKFGVLSNSGTSSLQVALQTLKEVHDWQDGDEVIVPAVTFVATVNVVLHNNLKPVLVDVDPRTYNIDPSKIVITDKTRAIIPVHLFGQPADMTGVRNAIAGTDVKVIEDSCECMYATHNGESVGSMGEIGCFSTYVAHILTTGVGGICTTNNPKYAEVMRSLVNHGRDGIYISIDDNDIETMSRRFKFPRVGHSYRVTELESAIGVAQLDDMERQISIRKQIAEELTDKLSHFEQLQLPYIDPGNDHVFMMYPIVLLGEHDKWDLCEHLENWGIETREMMPLTNQPAYDFDEDAYPVAKMINKRGFYIGSHHDMTSKDTWLIYDAFDEYFSGH